MVREGLERLDGVESVSEQANHKTQTCELRTRGGRLLSYEALSQHVSNLRLGARLRGVEATVDGWLQKRGEQLFLRISGTNEVVRLSPLIHMVQLDFEKKRPQLPTAAETHAYESLRAEWKSKPHRVLITGPLVTSRDSARPILEVRSFDLNP